MEPVEGKSRIADWKYARHDLERPNERGGDNTQYRNNSISSSSSSGGSSSDNHKPTAYLSDQNETKH